jgi:hypothetical protein
LTGDLAIFEGTRDLGNGSVEPEGKRIGMKGKKTTSRGMRKSSACLIEDTSVGLCITIDASL